MAGHKTKVRLFGVIAVLQRLHFCGSLRSVNAAEIIEQIKALPSDQRAQVTKFVFESDDSWIPEEFKQGMDDIAAGRVVDLDTALNEPYPGGQ